ncbi:methyltransferase, partial [Candidatus Woesearchaeota archaeon]|nr:methyltransferase [Candidatus Woesearchaeota archaeon]
MVKLLTLSKKEIKKINLENNLNINLKSLVKLIDDFYLAIESAKLNLKGEDVYFHYNDTLKEIEENSIDLVVSNPPFHFEYETNIEISLNLFKDVTY